MTGLDVHKGRGLKIHEPPVKILAESLGLPVIQPASLKSQEFMDELSGFNFDILVVVAFRILPTKVLEIPPRGAINLHASILPKYRGAAPVNWALINGDKETGVTVFQIKPKVDTGDILLQRRVNIQPDDTVGSLSERLSIIGAEVLVEALDGLENDTLTGISQDGSLATGAPKIFPELGMMDWTRDAGTLKNLIHGLSPNPGAYTFFWNKRMKILTTAVEMENTDKEPGTIVIMDKKRLGIQTGSGILLPTQIQMEGRRPLAIVDFLRGFQGKVGEQFGL